MRIGLTGGIACGKSTAADILARQGCAVVQTDRLAHQVLETPPLRAALLERWGARVFTPDGMVNRPAVAQIIFNDTAEKSWLESMVHPAVRHGWEDFLRHPGQPVAVVEIPLLFEKNLETALDLIVCVHCTQQMQLIRMATRGLSADQARQRLESQWPLEEKVRRSHYCLFNEGEVSFLERQISLLLTRIAATPAT